MRFFAVLLAAALLAQEPTFDSNARLVLVPFNVERGKYYVADLQAADFILREDGHPRPFTVFEGPHTANPLPLELILLFDTTPKVTVSKDGFRDPFWSLDPKADYEFLDNWDESATREVLEKNGTDVRISVYHYSGQQLERICAASSDPREIVHAFHSLLTPIPEDKGELTLLPGDKVMKPLFGAPKAPWMSESIVGALQDAAASPAPARRLLILFTSGSGGTTSGSLDSAYSTIVDPALAASIPINPVIMDVYKQKQHLTTGTAPPGGALSSVDTSSGTRYAGLLPWVVNVGDRTGGERFVPERLNRETLAGILGSVRDTALAQYVVGFSPDAAAAKPKKHSLAVALSSKSKGKLIGGEKYGVIY